MLHIWIQEQIRQQGPATMAQFMESALYHPKWGYYTRGPHIGPRGDFTTSPEASSAFGAMLARHVAEVDVLLGHPQPLHILECGPGQGTLARDLLDSLQAEATGVYERTEYILMEISPALRAAQQSLLALRHGGKTRFVSGLEELITVQGAIIANEFLDAFPVHVLRQADGELAEEYVSVAEGKLVRTLGPPSDPRLTEFVEKYSVELQEGETIEVSLSAAGWLETLGARLNRGVALFLDYGDTQPRRYSDARREGTLLGYRGGSVTADLLAHPGEQDVTALVDFTHMSDAATSAGFDLLGITRQATLLIGLGLGEESASPLAQADVESALHFRRGLQALISMEGLGRFHALLLSKGVDPTLASERLSGLRYRDIL